MGSRRAAGPMRCDRLPRRGPDMEERLRKNRWWSRSWSRVCSVRLISPTNPTMHERNPYQIPCHAQRQPRANAHARSTPVRPLDRHDCDPIPTSTREVDHLGIEDDACDLLALEEVATDRRSKALEAALRVRHRTRDPRAGEQVEEAAQQPPMKRLARPTIGAVGLDAAAERHVGVSKRGGEKGQLV